MAEKYVLLTLIRLLRLPSQTQNFGTKAWLLLYVDKEFGIGMKCGVQKGVFLFGLGRMVVIVFGILNVFELSMIGI